MITKETAARIWDCYREISAAEKMLADMQTIHEKERIDEHAPTLKDAFGYRRHLQLGVPSGPDAYRLYNISPFLAESVIKAHIANKQAELAEANEQARIELGE